MARTDAQWRFNPAFVSVWARGLWLWACIYQPCCLLRCVTVRESPGWRNVPLALRKLSPWDASANEQWSLRGAALLIKAGVVCQCRHTMHGAITVRVKTKRKARLLQQICCFTIEAKHLTTAKTPVASSVSISLIRDCTCRTEAQHWSQQNHGIRWDF